MEKILPRVIAPFFIFAPISLGQADETDHPDEYHGGTVAEEIVKTPVMAA